ncbi:MAG: hypothetical protein H8D56_19030 [Planctomycetes bacterium]|nr:hypothetical protein [Planctomycetota bacterium]MBL7142848.1 hypothetical protein [Phycisphaerae bacterium]
MLVKHLVKANRSTRYAVSASLIVIAILAMYNWLVAPHIAYLSVVQGYESVITKLVNKNKIIDNHVKIKSKKLQELQEKSAKLQSTLFTSDKAREFFSDLQAISEQTDCMVYSLNMVKKNSNEPSENTSGIVTKSAILSIVGLYKDIPRLIQRLQARPQKVWIDSIKVLTIEYNSDRPRCDITITICEIRDEVDTL